MWFTAAVVAVGVAVGLLFGGRPGNVPAHAFPRWGLLIAGVGLQFLVGLDVPGAFGLLIVSYGCLILFGVLNLAHQGMLLIVLGMVMNLIPIALNRGMPVHADAMVAAGLTKDADDARTVDLAGQRHVATTKDRARFLSDILPLRPLRQVVSFGDLVLGVGTIDLVVGLLRTPPRARIRQRDRDRDRV